MTKNDMEDGLNIIAHKECSVEGCIKQQFARGLCGTHYNKLRRYGDVNAGRVADGSGLQWIIDNMFHEGDECLIWPYSLTKKGRARAIYQGKRIFAQRLMCMIRHGKPPTPEHETLHSCGKGHLGCMHPDHMKWGTHAENMAEMAEHGTSNHGEKNPFAKLTEPDVMKIKRLLLDGMSRKNISTLYPVSEAMIGSIDRGESWARVEPGKQDAD